MPTTFSTAVILPHCTPAGTQQVGDIAADTQESRFKYGHTIFKWARNTCLSQSFTNVNLATPPWGRCLLQVKQQRLKPKSVALPERHLTWRTQHFCKLHGSISGQPKVEATFESAPQPSGVQELKLTISLTQKSNSQVHGFIYCRTTESTLKGMAGEISLFLFASQNDWPKYVNYNWLTT